MQLFFGGAAGVSPAKPVGVPPKERVDRGPENPGWNLDWLGTSSASPLVGNLLGHRGARVGNLLFRAWAYLSDKPGVGLPV